MRAEKASWLAAIEAEAIGWLPLGEGAYLHVGDPEALVIEEVQDTFGYALHLAQVGQKHPDAKPLKGFGSAGVLEVVEDFQGDAYRAVYTVKQIKQKNKRTPTLFYIKFHLCNTVSHHDQAPLIAHFAV